MKTIKLFRIAFECSFDNLDFAQEVCRDFGGFFHSDLKVVAVVLPKLTLDSCVNLIPFIYQSLDYPVLEVAIIRDQQGNPIEFNPETLLPYVASEQKEE